MAEPASSLRLLQEALVQLKQEYPQLKLRKGDPFPVEVSVSIPAPPAAERYDVDGLRVGLQLSSSILQLPAPPDGALRVAVSNQGLPSQLRAAICQQLHAAWASAVAASTQQQPADPFGLAAALQYAEQHFVQLLNACPGCVEAYEGVDSNGATQRRYAIIVSSTAAAAAGDDSDSTEAPTAAAPSAPAAAPTAGAAVTRVQAAGGAAAAAGDVGSPASSQRGQGTQPQPQRVTEQVSLDATQPLRHQQQSQHQHQHQQQQQGVPAVPGSSSSSSSPVQQPDPAAGPTSHTQSRPGPSLSAAAAPFQPTAGLRAAPGAATAAQRRPASEHHQSQQQQQQRQQHNQHSHQQQQQQQQQQAHNAAAAALHDLQVSAGATTLQAAAVPGSGRGGQRAGVSTDHNRQGGRGRGRGGVGLEGLHIVSDGGAGGVQQQQLQGPELAARDLQAAQRRYGRSFRLQQQQQQQQVTGQGAAGDAQQQQQQHQAGQSPTPPPSSPPPQQQQQENLTAATAAGAAAAVAPQSFSIMLQPTDPMWGASRGPLYLTGTLQPVLYPDPGSLALTLNPSRGVAAAEVWVLQEALRQQLTQQVGRAWQLRTVLRWLENYAGSELDRCFQAQQQLVAGTGQGQRPAGQQQVVQQQQQKQQHQSRSGTAGARRKPQQLTAAAAAAATGPRPSAVSAAAPHNPGGIRVIRATQQPTGLQQQQQQRVAGQIPGQQQKQQQQEVGGVDADLGLRLKPLVPRRKADAVEGEGPPAASWLVPQGGGASRWHPEPAGSDNSSSDGSSGSNDSSGSSASGQFSRGGNRHHGGGSSGSEGSGNDGSDDSDSDNEQSEGRHDELQLHGGGQGSSSTGSGGGPGGWAVTLEGLKLDNVGVVEVVTATLQLSCSRCSSSTTVVLTAQGGSRVAGAAGSGRGSEGVSGSVSDGSAAAASPAAPAAGGSSSSRAFEWAGSCSTCRQELGVLLRPRFVHEGSNVLAGLKTVGCSPLDLLPSVYGATCADCDAVGALRSLQVGVPASRSCGHCHRTLGVSIPAVAFIPQGPPTGGRAGAGGSGGLSRTRVKGLGAGSSRGAGGALVEGSPLPHNGACKHYRHSYRWLRFPCCGARFPCDLCHEEASADGHDAAWATRMVCGFCSREQPLGLACKHCGKKLATSASKPSGRNTRHWEGGAGCRDAKMLDRRDAAKYRNSKAKTKSAKGSRVGPKPWSGASGGGPAGGAASGSRSS